jgi:hypothetical protein
MRSLILFIIMVSQVNRINAQTTVLNDHTTQFEIKSGYSVYNMQQLSKTIHDYQDVIGLPTKIVADYPGFLTFGLRGSHTLHNLEIGIDYTYYSTGARSQYRDYSGEVGLDETARTHSIGVFGKVIVYDDARLSFSTSALFSLYNSRVDFREYMTLPGSQSGNRLEVVSRSLCVTPFLESAYQFYKNFYVGARIGYAFDLKGELHDPDNKKLKLIDNKGNVVHTDWTGLRAEAFVGIRMKWND